MTSARSTDLEIMDDLNCNGDVLHQTLRELEVINCLLGGNHVTIEGLRQLKLEDAPVVEITDLGCGSGDMLRRIDDWAHDRRLNVQLTGIDANPNVVVYARRNLSDRPGLRVACMNILSEEFSQSKFDVATATLFLHHFSHAELVRIFSRLARQARRGIVINDLHRHWFAFHSIRLLTRLFSKSPMVKFDAPLSVKRGFSRKEIESILHEAGIHTFSLRWRWAFRWQIVIDTRCLTQD